MLKREIGADAEIVGLAVRDPGGGYLEMIDDGQLFRLHFTDIIHSRDQRGTVGKMAQCATTLSEIDFDVVDGIVRETEKGRDDRVSGIALSCGRRDGRLRWEVGFGPSGSNDITRYGLDGDEL
jgi:hypothetical protein